MTNHYFSISLADDAFCIGHHQVKLLKRLCHCVTATLVGVGIEVKRKFAILDINDQIYLADTVTGTLFDANGRHHTEVNLRVTNIPAIKLSWAREVRNGGRH